MLFHRTDWWVTALRRGRTFGRKWWQETDKKNRLKLKVKYVACCSLFCYAIPSKSAKNLDLSCRGWHLQCVLCNKKHAMGGRKRLRTQTLQSVTAKGLEGKRRGSLLPVGILREGAEARGVAAAPGGRWVGAGNVTIQKNR